MPHPTTDPAPPATARQGTARQGSDPAGPWEDRWDPERGGGFAWQWDPAELARFEQWHEQTLARQLAQAAALPDPLEPFEPAFPLEPFEPAEPADPLDPFEPAFPLERDDLLEPTGPSGAAGPSGADGPDGDGGAGLGPSLQDAADAVLAQIEALEADRSRLDERLLAAYAALHAVLGEQLAEPEDPAPGTAGMGLAGLGVDEVVLAEVSTATGVPHGEAARRLRLAVAPRRYARLRSRLAAGTVSLLHATMIAEALEGLAREQRLDGPALEQVAGQVTERVLAALPDGSRPTHAQVRARLSRVIRSLQDPATTRARRAAARARRGLHAQLTEDGMGVLSLHTGAEQVVAVMDRIEHLARAMRQAGDPRCLDQLRADLAAEALLRHGYGPCPTHTTTSTSTSEAPATDQTPASTTVQDAEVEGAIEGADTAAAVQDGEDCETATATEDGEATGVGGDGLAGRPCGCVPTAPPAQAWIVVPFEVATGTSHAACELPGHGWVTAEHAREIITAPGSSWRWLAVDHLSGQALTLGTDRYRPTPAITEQVRALDGHCRAPGCTTPARRCDLDHHTPYPDGPTTVANLGPLHRAHHNLKTHHLWTCTRPDPQPPEQHPDPDTTLAARTDRGLAWRTLTGRDYLTYPKSWTEALHDPTHPEHTPPTRHHPQTPTERRAHHTQQRHQHPDWNDPPPF